MFSHWQSIRLVSFCVWTAILGCGFAIAQQPAAPPQTGKSPNSAASPDAKKAPPISAEAKVALDRGVEFLEAKQNEQAIAMFSTAARLHPRQGQIRHLLGVAYVQEKRLGEAWLQFRQAVRLSPRYTRGIRDFLALWQGFEKQGVFNAGQTTEAITRQIGKPDARKPDGGGETWEYGFKRLYFVGGRLQAVVDPRGMDQSMMASLEALDFSFDDEARWRLGYRSVGRLQALREFVPKEQGVQKWQEMYVVQTLHGIGAKKTVVDLMTDIETNLKKANPAIEFRVLSKKPTDVLFHWRDAGDEKEKRQPQHEIVRLLADNTNVHRFAYVRRVPQIPTADAKTWANILSQASIKAKTPGQPVAPTP